VSEIILVSDESDETPQPEAIAEAVTETAEAVAEAVAEAITETTETIAEALSEANEPEPQEATELQALRAQVETLSNQITELQASQATIAEAEAEPIVEDATPVVVDDPETEERPEPKIRTERTGIRKLLLGR